MSRSRLILAGVAALLTLGSLAASGGYAWYLHSDAYRLECGARLAEALNLPAEIGRVIPLSRKARAFENVQVWLPDHRAVAHRVKSAVITATPSVADPNAYEIFLSGGHTDVSAQTWLSGDYRRVMESGLAGGFVSNGPERVQFDDMNIQLERDQFHLALQNAAGQIRFLENQRGLAEMLCRRFNGMLCAEPAFLTVEFQPYDHRVRILQLDLTLPRLPLRAAGIGDWLGLPDLAGDFSGHTKYGETETGRWFEISGNCHNLDLAELTARLGEPRWKGQLPNVELLEFSATDDQLKRLRFRGQVQALTPGALGAALAWPEIPGELDLNIAEADISPTGINKLAISGAARKIGLEALTGILGSGKAGGVLRFELQDLTIVDNHLHALDARLVVDESDGTPRWIEGALLQKVAEQALQIQLPSVLPERIEVAHLGLRIEIRDEQLTVFGSHGNRENTILTVKLMGQELPLIFEPKQSYDLTPWLDSVRTATAAQIMQQAARWPAAKR